PTGILDQATIAKINSELSSSSTVAQQTSQTTTNPTFTATTTTGGFAGGGGSSVGGGGSSTTVTITPPPVPTTAPVQTTYTIIATANAGGTITPNGTTTVTANASKSFSITPNSNYQITSVLIDNQAVNSASTYNFANIQTNHTIAVTFSAIAAASNNNQANNVVSTFIQPQITKTFTDYASPVKLGMNNGKPSSWTRDMSFVDLKHILRPWGGSNPWEADPNMKYDSEKYPLTDASTMTEMYNYPLGTYKLSYEGGGLIDLDERYMGKIQNRKIVNNKTTADIVIDSKSSFLKLRMSGNTLENPIRNIQIITPGYQPGQIFTDEYIKAMRPFKIIRFMDWNNTNTSKDIHWSDRYKPTDGQYSGFSYEMMIALGNAIKRDIWIDVPDQADDNYIENLAKLIHDQLDPSLTAYIEYSNEVWNYAFPQWKRVYAASQLNNELTADPITNYSARIQQQVAFQTKKIADIFKKEYGSEFKKRVKVVLAGQSVNPWIITQSLDFLEQKYGSNLSDYLGALSMAVYIHPPKKTDTPLTMDGLFNALNNYVDEQVRPRIKIHKSLAQKYGLPLVAYEGGQALFGVESSFDAQKDLRMGKLYDKLFKTWIDEGGDYFISSDSIGSNASGEYWGVLPDIKTVGSVKWDAHMRALLPLGDATTDGVVNSSDYSIIKSNFGKNGMWWRSGDFTMDGLVDSSDLNLFKNNATGLTSQEINEIDNTLSAGGNSPGIVISAPSILYTDESGKTDTFQINLSTKPSSNVSISFSSSNSKEGTVSPLAVNFDQANWNIPKTITVTGVGDTVVDGDKTYYVIINPAVSNDLNYNKKTVNDIKAINKDVQPPQTPTSLKAEATSSSQVNLTWTADQNATNYIIERKLVSNSQWSIIATLGSDKISYSDTGLSPETQYEYKLTAKNSVAQATSNPVAVKTPPVAVTPDNSALIAYYTFDDGTVTDLSGKGNNGTLVGNPSVVTGRVGKALMFTGGADESNIKRVDLGNPANLVTPSEITVSVWAKSNNLTSIGSIVSKYAFSTGKNGFAIYQRAGNMVAIVADSTGMGFVTLTGASDLNWNLWTMTFKNNVITFYKNGVEKGTANWAGGINSSSNRLFIGAAYYTNTIAKDGFDGAIDDVRIYNKVLSAAEVLGLYNSYPSSIATTKYNLASLLENIIKSTVIFLASVATSLQEIIKFIINNINNIFTGK
ncbi:MAG: LamG-like jellyroll fold domain-containing protein, partial [Patescibacteria group bacterium]